MTFALDLLRLARPKQWAKSAFVMIGPLYALADHSGPPAALLAPAAIAAAAFALVSSASYIVNDIKDAPLDRLHPRKSRRPIASGRVSPTAAGVLAAVLLAVGLGLCLLLDGPARWWVMVLGAVYWANVAAYTFVLKRLVIADVVSLSLGFVIRVLAGCAAAGVSPSTWLLNCTLFLAMFLAFGKRLGERRTAEQMGADAAETRSVQKAYTDELLRMATVVTGVANLVTYAGWIQSRDGVFKVPLAGLAEGVNLLWLSIVPATYALLRCIVLLERGRYDDPTELAAKDRAMQASVAAFVCITGAAIWLSQA